MKDVTSMMGWDNPDDECLPITQCICGHKPPVWDFVLSIYEDDATECPKCKRKFFFKQKIIIYQVEDEEEK